MEVMELANLVRKRKLPCVCVGGCLSVSLSLPFAAALFLRLKGHRKGKSSWIEEFDLFFVVVKENLIQFELP
jgi:hypothetical protein